MQLRNKFDCIDWRPWKRDETIEIIALLLQKNTIVYNFVIANEFIEMVVCVCVLMWSCMTVDANC